MVAIRIPNRFAMAGIALVIGPLALLACGKGVQGKSEAACRFYEQKRAHIGSFKDSRVAWAELLDKAEGATPAVRSAAQALVDAFAHDPHVAGSQSTAAVLQVARDLRAMSDAADRMQAACHAVGVPVGP